jgi:hypothetical protein
MSIHLIKIIELDKAGKILYDKKIKEIR